MYELPPKLVLPVQPVPPAFVRTVVEGTPNLVTSNQLVNIPNSVVITNSKVGLLAQKYRENPLQLDVETPAQPVNWGKTHYLLRDSDVSLAESVETIIEGRREVFNNSAFFIFGEGGIVVRGGSLTVIPDNSNTCSNYSIYDSRIVDLVKFRNKLRTYNYNLRRLQRAIHNGDGNLYDLVIRVDSLVERLLSECRGQGQWDNNNNYFDRGRYYNNNN